MPGPVDPRTRPPLGIGTWRLHGGTCVTSVATALEAGYRHLDTAQAYDNEDAVGRGLARADVDRDEVLVATKVAPENLGYDDLVASARASRDQLDVDRIDLLYVHWPRAAYDPEETLGALADLVADGVVGGVGLSNFTPALLDEALGLSDDVVAHQAEVHPLLPQPDLRAHAREHDYALVAYSPLARGRALDLDPVRAVAARHDATPAQVALAWAVHSGAVPIPKASGDHVVENLGALALDLSDEDVARIDAVDGRERLVDPSSAPWN
jgi:diketogulonate reductase-like aldo/keto reductase